MFLERSQWEIAQTGRHLLVPAVILRMFLYAPIHVYHRRRVKGSRRARCLGKHSGAWRSNALDAMRLFQSAEDASRFVLRGVVHCVVRKFRHGRHFDPFPLAAFCCFGYEEEEEKEKNSSPSLLRAEGRASNSYIWFAMRPKRESTCTLGVYLLVQGSVQ